MQVGRDTVPAIERWAGAGHSDDPDPARAGPEAVAAAIQGEDPRLVLVFASPRHSLDALAHQAHRNAGSAELIGCSSAGEHGVSAFALGGPGFSVATANAALADAGSREAGRKAARCLANIDPRLPHRALIVLADAAADDPQNVVRGAYSVAGPGVSLAGGFMADTGHLQGSRALRGSVVAAALASEGPLGVGVRHGWRTRDEPLLVTGSEGRTLLSLNDQPALDVFLEVLDAPESAHRDPPGFMRFAQLHPFGVASAREREPQIRAFADVDFESRSLVLGTEAPDGTLVWPMEAESEDILNATAQACEESVSPLRGAPPLGLLAFNSVARAALLEGHGRSLERARIIAAGRDAPFASLGTDGEIARTRGFPGVHSHSLAVLAIG
jgi:hypothetical protein